MFILLLILRKSLTYLRLTVLRHVLPFDQNIYLHKLVGVIIAAYSLFHTMGHIGNAGKHAFNILIKTTYSLFHTNGTPTDMFVPGRLNPNNETMYPAQVN